MIDVLKIEGTPTEMGFAHGETYKEKILHLIDERTQILFREIENLNKSLLEKTTKDCYRYFKKMCPNIELEVRATAKAAGIDPNMLIVAGGYTDLLDILNTQKEISDYGECSVIVNPTGGFIAGTWDSHSSAVDGLILLERDPKDSSTKTLALTTAGWPCQQGVNSKGLAFAITNLTPKKAKSNALNYICANAVMGCSSDIDEFLNFSSKVNFASGHSYLMLDKLNNACIVETDSNQIGIANISENYVKTNHYSTKIGLDDNSNYPYLKGSLQRQNEFSNFCNKNETPLSFSQKLLESSFVNKIDETQISSTCATFFIIPDKLEIHFSKGSAKKTMYKASLEASI